MVPDSVKIAFAIGAFVFMASILVTVFSTKEYPPEDAEAFEREKREGKGLLGEVVHSVLTMPRQMFAIGVVQFFSWLAFFSMWSLATPALTEHVFKAPAPDPAAFDMAIPVQAAAFATANGAFQDAADLVGSYMGYYGLSSMLVALLLSFIAARRRDRFAGTRYPAAGGARDALVVSVGVLAWVAFAFWGHLWLIGVAPFG